MIKRIGILAYEGMSLFEAACALELFALPRPEFDTWFDCTLVGLTKRTVSTNVGTTISVQPCADFSDYDLLIIPSWFTDGRPIPPNIKTALTALQQSQKPLISFCSGAFLLASLGFLQGKEATTHWRYAEQFKALFPHVNYRDDVLYVFDGRMGCSAGSSAAIDLGLEIIRQDKGHQAANTVARRMVLSAHRKGAQTQFAESPIPSANCTFGNALDWAKSQLNQPLSISQIAQKANMSRRNFDRKFKANFNLPPKTWLTHQRLNLAKSLLESSDMNIDHVAHAAGFRHSDVLRHHFRRHYGISPNAYREQFQQR